MKAAQTGWHTFELPKLPEDEISLKRFDNKILSFGLFRQKHKKRAVSNVLRGNMAVLSRYFHLERRERRQEASTVVSIIIFQSLQQNSLVCNGLVEIRDALLESRAPQLYLAELIIDQAR